jgi:hypothetical protein
MSIERVLFALLKNPHPTLPRLRKGRYETTAVPSFRLPPLRERGRVGVGAVNTVTLAMPEESHQALHQCSATLHCSKNAEREIHAIE